LLFGAWRLGRGRSEDLPVPPDPFRLVRFADGRSAPGSDPVGNGATGRCLDPAEARIGNHGPVNTAAAILLGLFVLLIVLGVLALFVWAAKKDGEEDDAVQRRLGIRRKTRLGR
jgi:hypothetical protein